MNDALQQVASELMRQLAAGGLWWAAVLVALLMAVAIVGLQRGWFKGGEPPAPPKPPVDVGGPEIPDAEWGENTDLDNRPPG